MAWNKNNNREHKLKIIKELLSGSKQTENSMIIEYSLGDWISPENTFRINQPTHASFDEKGTIRRKGNERS